MIRGQTSARNKHIVIFFGEKRAVGDPVILALLEFVYVCSRAHGVVYVYAKYGKATGRLDDEQVDYSEADDDGHYETTREMAEEIDYCIE